jgi:hypothetical protein
MVVGDEIPGVIRETGYRPSPKVQIRTKPGDRGPDRGQSASFAITHSQQRR